MDAKDTLRDGLGRYLSERLGHDVTVPTAWPLSGGVSRETWAFTAQWAGASRDFVIHLDSGASLVETDHAAEYAAYEMFWPVEGVPVPEPILNEDDPGPLGKPFFLTAFVEGAVAPPAFMDPKLDDNRQDIARQMMRILGRIHATGTVPEGAPGPHEVWRVELDRWTDVHRRHSLGPMLVTEAAMRHLRRNPPAPPKRTTVAHGDFRLGNCLFTPDAVTGVIDWEMSHPGDPHEDLAWALLRNWRFGASPGLVAGALPPGDAIREWEDASGLTCNLDSLRWWTLLNHVKACGLWVTGAHELATGRSRNLSYAFIGWAHIDREEVWMLDAMEAPR